MSQRRYLYGIHIWHKTMKIFMVHEDPWHAGNPYVYTLIEGLKCHHPDCKVGWGRAAFWSDDIYNFDIVHFHWPQTFMGKDNHSDYDLLRHIEKMTGAGVKVVATCHDMMPHYDSFADKAECMKICALKVRKLSARWTLTAVQSAV